MPFFSIPFFEWLILAFGLVLAFLLKGLLVSFIGITLKPLGSIVFKQTPGWFQAFRQPLSYFVFFAIAALLLQILPEESKGFLWAQSLFEAGLGISGISTVCPLLHLFIDSIQNKIKEESSTLHDQFFKFTKQIISVVVFVLGSLMVIQNLG